MKRFDCESSQTFFCIIRNIALHLSEKVCDFLYYKKRSAKDVELCKSL